MRVSSMQSTSRPANKSNAIKSPFFQQHKQLLIDITTTESTDEDDDASDGGYSVESDFTEISLTATMADADDEITIDP